MAPKNQTKRMEHICACEIQLVWYFTGKWTIVACIDCERTYCHEVKFCPTCSKPVTFFTKDEE